MIPYIKTHVFYVVLIAAGLIFVHYWQAEHDARVAADAQVKTAQTSIANLQTNIAATNAAAASERAALVRALSAIKTPAQAVAAIPTISTVPLNSRVAVDNHAQVSVDAVALYTELNQCAQTTVALNSCTVDLKNETAIVAQQQTEIVALKKKPKFLTRVKHVFEAVAVGVGIGVLLVH